MPNGISSAQMPSMPACARAAQRWRGSTATWSRRTTHCQATTSDSAHQQAREDAGQEQLADRDVGDDAEHDEADRRRDHRRDHAAGGDQAGRARHVVAGAAHHRDQQRADRRGVGGGAAGDRGHHHRRRRPRPGRGRRGCGRPRRGRSRRCACEMPPAFISSPASMKNGIASSGKLSAPSSSFCDRMVASIWPCATIRATRADEQGERDRHAERHRAEQREREDGDGHRRLRRSCFFALAHLHAARRRRCRRWRCASSVSSACRPMQTLHR